jgi:hypothetical protein
LKKIFSAKGVGGAKRAHKEDAGLELNVSKTSVLPKGVTQQAAFDAAHSIINNSPALTQLRGDVSLASSAL